MIQNFPGKTSGLRTFLLFACGASALFAGCASVKTLPGVGGSEATRIRLPAGIYVQAFATSGGRWQKNAASPEKRIEIRDWLSGRLLLHLAALAPTHLLEIETKPTSGWLVTGRFLHVNPGSRLGRMFLGGVGVGASKLETKVDVFDLAVSATEPIVSFTTTGGSNLALGVPGAMAAIDDDVERTAREIHDFLKSHLWPAESERGRPEAPPAISDVDILPPLQRGR